MPCGPFEYIPSEERMMDAARQGKAEEYGDRVRQMTSAESTNTPTRASKEEVARYCLWAKRLFMLMLYCLVFVAGWALRGVV